MSSQPVPISRTTQITGATQLAAVIGDPVRHSLSPQLHNAAFAATGLDWVYIALPVASDDGRSAVEAMRTFGISGLNVTMPHKAAIAATVDRRTAAVAKLGACNCVFRDGDALVGDNTDGDGFVAALEAETGIKVAGMRVAVLGAGGAARAIIDALSRHQVDQILVLNRTPERARDAASLSSVAQVGNESDLPSLDLIVNATSVGMGKDANLPIDPRFLREEHLVADIVYQPRETPLLLAATAIGATTVGGLGMLVHQAAASFERFSGVQAPLDVMTAVVEEFVQTT